MHRLHPTAGKQKILLRQKIRSKRSRKSGEESKTMEGEVGETSRALRGLDELEYRHVP